MAAALDLKPRQAEIVSGHASAETVVRISGVPMARVQALVASWGCHRQ